MRAQPFVAAPVAMAVCSPHRLLSLQDALLALGAAIDAAHLQDALRAALLALLPRAVRGALLPAMCIGSWAGGCMHMGLQFCMGVHAYGFTVVHGGACTWVCSCAWVCMHGRACIWICSSAWVCMHMGLQLCMGVHAYGFAVVH